MTTMTKKNAKKKAARARQEKTGQSYQSALRAEGLTKEERDNLAGTPFVPRQPLEGFTVTPPPLRGWGLDGNEERKAKGLAKHVLEPAKIKEYWKDLPEAKRCTAPARRELGVTDEHPERPFTTWTPLTRCHETPGFIDWWNTLPQATNYAVFEDPVPPMSTADVFRAQYPGQRLPPGMKDPKV